MTNQVIPHAAVVAASGALWDAFESGVDDFEQQASAALEAAAPHMLQAAKADAWDEGVQAKSEYAWNDDMEPLTSPYRSQA